MIKFVTKKYIMLKKCFIKIDYLKQTVESFNIPGECNTSARHLSSGACYRVLHTQSIVVIHGKVGFILAC